MLKKTFLILNILILALMAGCSQKNTELLIDENVSKPASESIVVEEMAEEETKPLKIISSKDTALIFVRADGAPGMYLGDDGEVHGFYVDLEKMIMKDIEQNYKFIPYEDVGPVVQAMKSGTHHIALSVPDLPDYRSFANLSIAYEILHYVTFVQKNNIDINGSTKEEILKSLHGKKVGVQTQGHIYQVLREIKEIELYEYPTTTKAMEDLNKGVLDAVPDVKRIGLYYAEKNNWDIKPVGQPIISHRDTTAFSPVIDSSLMDRYNVALQKIMDDGRFEALYTSYFGPMDEEDKP